MYRSCVVALLAGGIGLVGMARAGEQGCWPALAVTQVQFSAMRPPALERKWTAVVAVDATRCAANSRGRFEIVVRRLKEIGPDLEFREQFAWLAPAVNVAVDFSADESVERYWIDNVTPCPCPG